MNDEVTAPIRVHAEPRSGRLKRWFVRLAIAGLLFSLLVFGGLIVAFSVIAEDLPTIESLKRYDPKQATVVFDKHGQVAARFANERRTVVSFNRIPKVMIDAVLAAEDAEFFQHRGLDYVGIARCALKSLLAGRTVCGGSTITQQMVKTFLLTPEKNIIRKLKEAILTKRVEESLSKQEILHLYLNQIYFGHSAYGIQEAARVYFDKNVEHLTLPDASLLAGLPQLPTRLDPYRFPEKARARRSYVLGQMLRLQKIDKKAYDLAMAAPLGVSPEGDVDSNNHYAAHVRQLLVERLGEENAIDGGLKVYTGIDPAMQRAAEQAVKTGLRALDKRQGWRGPLLHLEKDEAKSVLARLETRLSTVAQTIGEIGGADRPEWQPVIWDLSDTHVARQDGWLDVDKVVSGARFRRLVKDEIVAGVVTEVDDAGKLAGVRLAAGVTVQLTLRTGLSWARKFDTLRGTSRPKAASDVLSTGDVVLVRPTELKKSKDGTWEAIGELEQEPLAQAAVIAIDPLTREVRALVGGYGIGAGKFNRATQAKRQAGSTFKPLVYASAFETGEYTTITTCQDAPRVYRDQWTGKSWKPKNYDGKFDGELTLRTGLTRSKNLCSVELIDKIGVDRVIDIARRTGIESPLPRSLTLALGAGDIVPLEMVNAYTTIASEGKKAEPVFIKKIVDPAGKVLFEHQQKEEHTISPAVTYQITSLMQSVVEDGTAQQVKALARPVAGKTGTTNDAKDAWFIGFTPDLVLGVWVGFDDSSPLGPTETGGRAAIPIWLETMEKAVADAPVRDFVAPPGIVFAFVDPKTGRLMPPDAPGAASEPFVAGRLPTEIQTGAKPPINFGLDDFETR